MRCNTNRHGPRWEAFAERLRDQVFESAFGGEFAERVQRGGGRSGWRGGRASVLDGNELRLVLLKLIWEAPRHGYELIKAIETLSGGTYSPSPGMVYPTLTLLADLGQISEAAEGSRKCYTVTDAGAQLLSVEADAISASVARLEDLAKLNRRAEAPPVRRALRNLNMALQSRLAGAPTEDEADTRALQLDIAAIIDAATSQIERL